MNTRPLQNRTLITCVAQVPFGSAIAVGVGASEEEARDDLAVAIFKAIRYLQSKGELVPRYGGEKISYEHISPIEVSGGLGPYVEIMVTTTRVDSGTIC
jgi:predicted RNase H-like HicB family nuclease